MYEFFLKYRRAINGVVAVSLIGLMFSFGHKSKKYENVFDEEGKVVEKIVLTIVPDKSITVSEEGILVVPDSIGSIVDAFAYARDRLGKGHMYYWRGAAMTTDSFYENVKQYKKKGSIEWRDKKEDMPQK